MKEYLVMQFPVAQLLKSGVGATREYDVDDNVWIFSESQPERVRGVVSLLRTSNGILARAHLSTNVELECARCLKSYRHLLEFDFEEEYLLVLDIFEQEGLDGADDDEIFTIDENNILDITDAARQYAILAMPMKALCRYDCPGIEI